MLNAHILSLYFSESIHPWTEQKGKTKQNLKSSGKWKLCRLEGSAIRLPTPAASKTGSNQVAASFAAWLNIYSKWEPLSCLITKLLLLYSFLLLL